MKVIQQIIKINTEEKILSASISSPTEVVFLLSNSSVYRYNITSGKEESLFSVDSSMTYTDGGFDIESPSTLYTLDNIVVIANDLKFHTIVHYPSKYEGLRLQREDYYAEYSKFPIALFKKDNGVPHLIYGVAWNHVQIMNLDTRQVLTASKSLIEVDAEERRLEFFKNHDEKDDGDDTWPTPYDYFYGELSMSPDNTHFLSAGWVWGSADSYNVFNINHFINNHRIKDKHINFWEHENRACCWVSNTCIAVAYHPMTEGDDDATKDTPWEIHLYQIDNEVTLDKKFSIFGIGLSNSTFIYSKKFDAIVVYSDELGVCLINLDGSILFNDSELKMDHYNTEFDIGIVSMDNRLSTLIFS